MKLAQARWEEQEARVVATLLSLWLQTDSCSFAAHARIVCRLLSQARLRVVSEAYRTAELAKLCGDFETAACVPASAPPRCAQGSD